MTHDLEDRLREAFAYRSERTHVDADSSHPDLHEGTSRRRLPAMAALAAAGVLLIAGLVAVNAIRSTPSPGTVPLASLPEANLTPIDLTADDLSLDNWITTPSPDAPTPTWMVLDVAALPPGVELVSQAGSVLLTPPIDAPSETTSDLPVSHQYRAQLRDDNTGTVIDVAVSSSQMGGPCNSLIDGMNATATDPPAGGDAGSNISGADVNGINAAVSGSLVCWMPAPGVIASVEVMGSSSPDDLESSLVLARQLTFTDTARLPQPVAPGQPGPAPDSAEFIGTLNGIPWSATVSASALRTMNTYIDGRPSGAFSNDRLSQPVDTPAGTGELSLDAVPGKGAIAYGYTAPAVRTVRAINSTGDSVVLATFPRELETFFAVPIPDGVTIDTLEFLRSDGSIYATATIGPLPRDLAGAYGGLVPILRSPTPDD